MVQKGILKPTDSDSAAPEEDDGSTEKGKRSFGEKIKEKLSRTNYS